MRILLGVLKFLKDWAWITLSLASGGPALVVIAWFLFQGKEVPKTGLWSIIWACSILAAWVAWFQERRSHDDKTEYPRLRVAEGDFRAIAGFWKFDYIDSDGTVMHQSNYPFTSLVLDIENDPIRPTAKSVATDITARLTFFYDETGEELFDFEGRWSDSLQPPMLPKDRTPAELKTATIPIGARRRLDMVMKYNHEAVCYGVNNDSYSYDMAQNRAWRLGWGDYSVRVRLRGANVDQTFIAKFRNPQAGGPLEPISCKERTA